MHLGLRQSAAALAVASVLAVSGVLAGIAAEPSQWNYRDWQTQDGLPDISIVGVAQTTDGYLWVATKGGLACFNGQQFSTLPAANFPLLPSRAVRAMLRDHRDCLWLGMERGPVLCLKPSGLDSFATKNGLPEQRVVTMMEDKEGAVWIVYPNQLRRILNGEAKPVALPTEWLGRADLLGISDSKGDIWCAKGPHVGVWRDGQWQFKINFPSSVTAIGQSGNTNLWVATDHRLFRLQEGMPPEEIDQLPGNVVPSILLEDHFGALWLGTASQGLFRWEGRKLEKIPTSQQEITCLFEDQEGNILAGTGGGGLNLIRPLVAALTGRETGLPFESVQSVTEDTDGRVWAVGQEGELACMKDSRWEMVNTTTNWPGGRPTCVAADPKAGVWVGTSSEGLRLFRNGVWRTWQQDDGLVSDAIRSLLVARNGDVWIASVSPNRLQRLSDGKVRVMTRIGQLGAIRAMAEGADGTIWIGTAEGQIQRVVGSKLVLEPAIAEPLPLSVRTLLATADGRLWIGYAGDGLGHFKDGQYHRLTSADGLTDDFISQILADERGNLWLTGNRGLSRVKAAELDAVMEGKLPQVNARPYGTVDGLPGMQPNRNYCPSAWRDHHGHLWFSMRNGLLLVCPENIRDNPLPPPVHLEQVTVDDQLLAIYHAGSPLQTQPGTNVLDLCRDMKLELAPGHRKLEIHFAAMSFASPENVQFRYQLSGFDNGWVAAGSSHNATYPRLPAGEYEFRVIACNNSGVWNEKGAAIKFKVLPFFWETWWFKVGIGFGTVLVAGGCAFAISRARYRRRIRRLEGKRALEQERARIAKDIHDDLGASLTRISLLSQLSRGDALDVVSATENLAQIHQTAHQLTHAMGEVVWAVNPEHDTFDSLANYLSHYAQSFLRATAIRCRIEMPLQLPKHPLSAEVRHNLFLAFKEALNNVVKHAQATEVRITLNPTDSGFELIVADNGKGLSRETVAAQTAGASPTRPAPGNGLANMHSRLQEIGGECKLSSEPGTGTRITFRVVLRKYHG